jgi:hypothetical protein
MEVHWLKENNDLHRFYSLLKSKGDTDLYDDEVIKILLSCEEGYTFQLLTKGLLP